MTGALLALVAGYLGFLLVSLALIRDSDLRKFWWSRVLTATAVGVLLWKLTPFWTRFEDVFDNPIILLSAPGGLPGLLGGLFAFLAVVTLSLFEARRARRDVRRLPLVLSVAFGALLASSWVLVEPWVTPRHETPPAALTTVLNDLSGYPHTLADTKGRVTVVNFWATWCPPCLAELPEFQRFVAAPSDRLAVIGVNLLSTEKDGLDAVKKYVTDHKLTWNQLTDKDGTLQSLFQVSVIPTTIVLDPTGKVVDRREGVVDLSWLKGLEARFAAKP